MTVQRRYAVGGVQHAKIASMVTAHNERFMGWAQLEEFTSAHVCSQMKTGCFKMDCSALHCASNFRFSLNI